MPSSFIFTVTKVGSNHTA